MICAPFSTAVPDDAFPSTAEEPETLFAIVGRIVGTVAEERVLDESGKVDPARLDAIAFDQFRHGYYATGEKAGQAWNAGSALAKAALAAQDR